MFDHETSGSGKDLREPDPLEGGQRATYRGFRRAAPPVRLTANAGINRLVWDFNNDGGLMLPPGSYRVKMSSDSWSDTQPLALDLFRDLIGEVGGGCPRPRAILEREGLDEADAGGEDIDDDLYRDAVRICCEMGRASTSTLQRRLRIGYGRAAHLIDLMEKDGIVGPPDGTRPREVLKGRGWMKEFDEGRGE